jgi:hypothetical protein
MNKKQVQQRVSQNGKPLALSKFKWDEKTKTFSSKGNYLIIDFKDVGDCTFKTGWGCTFKTGPDCTFKTGPDCTFKTGWGCTFKTDSGCTFKTGWDCTFKTGPAPLNLSGPYWDLFVNKPNELSIGCENHSFAFWKKNAKRVASKNNCLSMLKEYKSLIEIAEAWANSKGWNK